MNNKYINISVLNLRITLLILGSLIFLGLSFILLFYQRTNTANTLDYSNIYIFSAILLILFLIFSLIYLLGVSNIKKYPNKVDNSDPVNTPIFTPSKYSTFSTNAKFPTNKLIVKPIPVNTPTP